MLISILIENFQDSRFQASYSMGPGFCIPHLFKIILRNSDEEIFERLFSIEKAKITQLVGELREFIRKHDYRFSKEPFGKERDAWIRAVEKLNGKAPLTLPSKDRDIESSLQNAFP